MTDKEQILNLKDGESYTVPVLNSKAEVWFKHGTYFLFSLPDYGMRRAKFEYDFPPYRIDDLIETIESWT